MNSPKTPSRYRKLLVRRYLPNLLHCCPIIHDGLPAAANAWQPKIQQGLSGLIGLLRLKQQSEILNHDATAEIYARAFLRGEHRDMLLKYSGWAGKNEFEKKRSHEAFVTQDAVHLRAITPNLPLTVMLTDGMELESYDNARKAFPLRSRGRVPMQIFDGQGSV